MVGQSECSSMAQVKLQYRIAHVERAPILGVAAAGLTFAVSRPWCIYRRLAGSFPSA